MVNSIAVGTAANLLAGYRPVWDPSGSLASPFFEPAAPPLMPQVAVETPSDFPYWSGTPVITLHRSIEALVSAIYDYRVLPLASDPQAIDVPSGPLSLGDADREQALAAACTFLGLDRGGASNFMLVRYERCASTAAAADASATLTAAAAATVAALPRAKAPVSGSPLYDSKLTAADARLYLAAIGALGTHVVTQVSNGDRLVQAFAYEDDEFKSLATQFGRAATRQADGTMAVTGTLANSWVIYTAPAATGGFAARYGALAAISRDPALGEAVAAGRWADGMVPSGTASIFAAARNYALLSALTREVTYACRLMPLAELLPGALVAGPWDRLVAGGLMQKHGGAVTIPLRRPLPHDWAALFPQSSDGFASGIVTPVVDIYQERIDLAKVQLMGAEIIGESFPMQSFSCFAQVLQATAAPGAAPIALPSDAITVVAQIIDTTQAAQTPVLAMSRKGLADLAVHCQDMYGAMIFQSDDASPAGRRTALDGFLMETPAEPDPATGRYGVDIAGVLSDPPGEAVLAAHLQSIGFSVTAGEALLQAQGPDAPLVRGLEVAFLNWLARIIPADTANAELAEARVRALYLANAVATFGVDAVFVPYASYDAYSKYVGDLVNQATDLSGTIAQYQTQLTVTVAKFQLMTSIQGVNDNVRSIGGVLTQYFKALTDGRQAMDGYYDAILAQLDSQLQATLKNIGELQAQLVAQQDMISRSGTPKGIVQRFEQDYANYAKDEVAKAVVGIVTGLFTLGVSIASLPTGEGKGILDALKYLKDVFDKLQAVMAVIAQLGVIEKVTKDVAKLNVLAGTIQAASDAGRLAMPSAVEIDMIPLKVEAALANVDGSNALKQDKADLIAATKGLALVGAALLNAQAEASRLLVEISNTQRLKTMNGNQQARMSALTRALHLDNPAVPPDLAKVDLIGMTGQLQFQLKQVLAILARVLERQNGALQFSYFGQPMPIGSFSLAGLLGVISAQDASILDAVEHLQPPPQALPAPITVRMASIPHKELTGGRFKRIAVHLSDPGFLNYVMVRIDRVVPRVTGVASTASGQVEIALETQAQPFLDRDTQRDTRTFASTRRAFGPYVYDVATGAPTFGTGTGSFADKVTHLTPFTDWLVSLPAKSVNRDIAFDGLLVDIEIDFHVTAIFNDPVLSLRRALTRHYGRRLAVAAPGAMRDDAAALAANDVPNSTPSLSYLQNEMYTRENVLNGWDAAFSMLAGPVNAFLNQQFQTLLGTLQPGSDTGLMKLRGSYIGTPIPLTIRGQTYWTSQVTLLSIDVTNPLLQFIAGSDQATVQQFIQSGTVTVGSVDVNGGTDSTGKNIPSTFDNLAAVLPAGALTFTVDQATNELVIATPGLLGAGLGSIYLSTTGTLPAPLAAGDPAKGTGEYFIVSCKSTTTETRIQLSTSSSPSAAPLVLTDAGTGVQTLQVGVNYAAPMTVVTDKNPYVLSYVQLSTIAGVVTPPKPDQGTAADTLTVMLDFPSGSFVIQNVHVDPPNWDPSPNATQISFAIQSFYATHDIKFRVQTINTKDLASDPSLTPSQFKLHALTTNAGNNVLQLLIATTGAMPKGTAAVAVTEPVAYDPAGPVAGSSNLTVSLMISPKLTFAHVFVDSFNSGKDNKFTVEAVAPSVDYGAWSAKIASGSVTAAVPFKDSYDVNGTKTHFRISASSNNITWDLSNLTFQRTATGGIALAYSNGTANPPTGGRNVDFQYQQYVYSPGNPPYTPGYWFWTDWTDASAMAYVSMTGQYPLVVTRSGRDQLIAFSTTSPAVTMDPSSALKPTGACECNNNDVQIALMDALKDAVPAQLQANMNKISFEPLSIMALESLLFPADQLIAMTAASVPSAALVVGSFLAQVRTVSPTYTVTIPASAGAQGRFGDTSFKNGTAVASVTRTGLSSSFTFSYGPIDATQGPVADYTLDINTGAINPPLIAVVWQPDAAKAPGQVTLLLPGYLVSKSTSGTASPSASPSPSPSPSPSAPRSASA